MGVAFLASLGSLSRNQLVEVALLSRGGCFLKQESQSHFIKFAEPVIPRDLFQRIGSAVAGEIQSQHADVALVASAAHAGRLSVALFRPPSNLVVIRGGVRCRSRCHNYFSLF